MGLRVTYFIFFSLILSWSTPMQAYSLQEESKARPVMGTQEKGALRRGPNHDAESDDSLKNALHALQCAQSFSAGQLTHYKIASHILYPMIINPSFSVQRRVHVAGLMKKVPFPILVQSSYHHQALSFLQETAENSTYDQRIRLDAADALSHLKNYHPNLVLLYMRMNQ